MKGNKKEDRNEKVEGNKKVKDNEIKKLIKSRIMDGEFF